MGNNASGKFPPCGVIYRWASSGIAGAKGNIFEVNRLKRENQQLKQIIGEMLYQKERGKKD
jgi:hypothetical protein